MRRGALHRNCRSLIARDPTRAATPHHEEVCHGKTFYLKIAPQARLRSIGHQCWIMVWRALEWPEGL